jgi:hypothetical protein
MNINRFRVIEHSLGELERLAPKVQSGLRVAQNHLREHGQFHFDPMPTHFDAGTPISLHGPAREAMINLTWVRQKGPEALRSIQTDDLDRLLVNLSRDIEGIYNGQLPDSPSSPLYRMPQIMAEASDGLRDVIAGTDVAGLQNAEQVRINAMRNAAMRVADAIQV